MWTEKNDALAADFKFKTFAEAWAFLTEVAFSAEKMNHHPTWTNTYNKVSILLTTHDAGNTVTEKDQKLAARIDQIFARFSRAA